MLLFPVFFFPDNLELLLYLRMRGQTAEGRLQVLQIYSLLQAVHKRDTAQIEKMVTHGVENLINLTEPKDGTGALHLAAVANNQGMGPSRVGHWSQLSQHGQLNHLQKKRSKGNLNPKLIYSLYNRTKCSLRLSSYFSMTKSTDICG